MLLNYDSVADVMKFNNFAYNTFVRNQLKYIIQEVIFFDRHYSRLFKKITAIAPLNADNATFYEGMPVMEALYGQILFWVPFDAFRPYMAKQYMTPKKNDNQRVTYDEFFEQRKFSSYIIGTNNVYNRMIPELVSSKLEGEALREAIKKEQDRVENELLNVEQDLWEY
jgi:gliding motility associated protien GldN